MDDRPCFRVIIRQDKFKQTYRNVVFRDYNLTFALYMYCTYVSLTTCGIEFIKLIIVWNISNLFFKEGGGDGQEEQGRGRKEKQGKTETQTVPFVFLIGKLNFDKLFLSNFEIFSGFKFRPRSVANIKVEFEFFFNTVC